MGSLKEKITAKQEEIAQERKEQVEKRAVVLQLKDKPKREVWKNKQISAKVNSDTYALFTDINRVIGLSNNSALNMMIKEYVQNKKYLLEEE